MNLLYLIPGLPVLVALQFVWLRRIGKPVTIQLSEVSYPLMFDSPIPKLFSTGAQTLDRVYCRTRRSTSGRLTTPTPYLLCHEGKHWLQKGNRSMIPWLIYYFQHSKMLEQEAHDYGLLHQTDPLAIAEYQRLSQL